MRFSGSFVPIVTPFDRKGRVDRKTFEKLIDWHVSEGTDGIVYCGTTGEVLSLSDRERKRVIEIAIGASQGRIPVVIGTGVSDTHLTVRYTESALKLGAQGALVVTPYYNKPTQKGIILHYTEVAKVGLPIIAYHNPTRAALRLTAETILELSFIPNIVAIKESSKDMELIRKIAKHIDVFSGDDEFVLEIMKEGAVGSIATSANVIPRGWKQLISLCLKKDWDNAQTLFLRYLPLMKALFLETNPQGVKFGLSWLKKCEPHCRLPLILPGEATQLEIKKAILDLSLPWFSDLRNRSTQEPLS